jgi:peptidylprolyl isomerase
MYKIVMPDGRQGTPERIFDFPPFWGHGRTSNYIKEPFMAVKDGNTVRVHYTGTFSDGEVFDSSREREPLEFTIGDGSLIPGFEDALLGHNAGDRFTVTIPADEAYGEHLEELLMEVPVSEVPEDIKPEVGMMLQIATDDGDMEVQIVEVNDKVVVLDANHPLAGEDLTFDIEVIDVK